MWHRIDGGMGRHPHSFFRTDSTTTPSAHELAEQGAGSNAALHSPVIRRQGSGNSTWLVIFYCVSIKKKEKTRFKTHLKNCRIGSIASCVINVIHCGGLLSFPGIP
ncbi:hypothetical protein [Bordetella sp. H567]|uniref:hypothetical protein n=1 Tax=Bordetella sp. H567 TaxID=1697043 RepID=UPI0011AB3882|nr:hypothetical protein [Bordetella sp. H567]